MHRVASLLTIVSLETLVLCSRQGTSSMVFGWEAHLRAMFDVSIQLMRDGNSRASIDC